MRITEVLDTTYGKLVNAPFISAFLSITCDVTHVKTGSLFFAKNKEEIKEAVEKGAYGIVFCGKCEIIDDEIAWIQVDSILEALNLLTRYILSAQNIKLVILESLELELAKDLELDAYIFEESGLEKLIEFIYDKSSLECFFLLTKDKSLKDLLPNTLKSSKIKVTSKLGLLTHTLLETTYTYKDKVFNLPLPYVFLPYLETLLATCEIASLEPSLINYKKSALIEFFYLDTTLYLSEKETFKTLMLINNKDVFMLFADYLEKEAKHLKLMLLALDLKSTFTSSKDFTNFQIFKDKDSLIKTIKLSDFNLCLTYGLKTTFLHQSFIKDTTSKGLF
ncbi:hypothetical protein BKH43_05575 [Helicobacter sp. 13S00401-1]|uniref:hypothetical protein n=1 Tax=Helicobacter sp. 13S00401-1 TaxID=1905758 RepID=UPI000BA79415|nr:hypothetical protein [Helicobacter sp. 13S00401-1]PAF50205.1 hypothetical protein BKH43_05575 [Helicobacter sp. 13S00401-1]